ncbi:hypothetical protein [Lactococcus sp. FSL W8-0209]|uniref:hypothetical protein n=1 Tax=Lactococcus sp. FSL W8-0209 TaxID=2921712 RepID=UPI0030F51C4A
MKIDLPELERKLSYGINLTIKESTILLESMEGFIDDKIELQEQLNTEKKKLTEEIESIEKYLDKYGMSSYGANTRQAYLEGLKQALAAIGGDDE